MIPAEVWTLDRLPVLGTGKADMVTLEKLVRERRLSALDLRTITSFRAEEI